VPVYLTCLVKQHYFSERMCQCTISDQWRSHGVGYGCTTSTLFENMGLIICPNLHRNSDGEGVVGTENVIEDRLRRVQVSPSRQPEIASPPIPNSIFSGESEGPLTPAKLASRAHGARERPPVSPVFRVPHTFKHLASSLAATTERI